ncbi:hypothetical protein RclHR1_13250002 [Rhizophagus clarus]|uniref:Uncharacterized protein n=1 Tax=Rhizophagus clarus TaxID=94130 RepID=A0A2Z6R251_9GLOM|nr:hypothetical protein RclHR1_13250002 [Rhizophagus clarus]GES78787.1 hypothetical protein RCL_jg21672.t1 [Rhizophagus clarus]
MSRPINSLNNNSSSIPIHSLSNRRRRVRNLLASINMARIFPPFMNNIRRIRTLLSHNDRRPRRRPYHGFDLFVIIVSEEASNQNEEQDYYTIRIAANFLWRRSTRIQRQDYIRLAQVVNQNRR